MRGRFAAERRPPSASAREGKILSESASSPPLPLQCPRSTPSSNRCGRWTWLGLEGTAAAGGDQELSNLPIPLDCHLFRLVVNLEIG